MVLSSDELNEKITAVCDENKTYSYEAFGGKTIPYFGWCWRPVAFDRDSCLFGILEENGMRRVGFDESGKDYGQVGAVNTKGAVWQEIKRLVAVAACNPGVEAFRALDDAIQALDRWR